MQNKSIKFLSLLFAAAFFVLQNLSAQDSLKVVKKTLFVHSSFFYDFPQSFGIAAGVDFPVSSKLKTTFSKNGKEKLSFRDLIIAGDIGFYRYRFNHSGLYFLSSIGKRYYDAGPYYFEMLLSIGVLRTFYDGRVYMVDDNGNIKEKKNFGRYYATSGLSFAFGHNFERSKKPRPFAIQAKPFIWIQYPYNSYLLPHLSAEFSLKYHFRNFNIRVKEKEIHKFKL